jgi:hypothetical protein
VLLDRPLGGEDLAQRLPDQSTHPLVAGRQVEVALVAEQRRGVRDERADRDGAGGRGGVIATGGGLGGAQGR